MKLTLAALAALNPGRSIQDPAVNGPGYALRYRRKADGVYADFMWKVAPGKWMSKSLGALPTGAELEDLKHARWDQRQFKVWQESGGELTELQTQIRSMPAPGEDLELMLEAVRQKAHELRKSANPSGGGTTLRQALEMHLASKPHSPRTVQEYRDKLRLHFGDWLDKPLAGLSRKAVKERHQQITRERGAYAANGSMRVFRACWNRAMREDESLPACPTINVDFHQEHRRDAAIPVAQLPEWWQAIGQLANPVRRDFYRLALFTGLRRRTLEAIRREHIDLEARTLHIPKPKGGKAFTLPLSGYLVELISARLAANEPDCPWLFPAESKSGHLTEPKPNGGWKGIAFTVHGLRNSYISAATAAGVHPYHLKLLVNHAVPKADVTAGYLSRDVDSLREPQQRVTDWLLEAVEGAPAREATILPLRAAL
jgi:integrase